MRGEACVDRYQVQEEAKEKKEKKKGRTSTVAKKRAVREVYGDGQNIKTKNNARMDANRMAPTVDARFY